VVSNKEGGWKLENCFDKNFTVLLLMLTTFCTILDIMLYMQWNFRSALKLFDLPTVSFSKQNKFFFIPLMES